MKFCGCSALIYIQVDRAFTGLSYALEHCALKNEYKHRGLHDEAPYDSDFCTCCPSSAALEFPKYSAVWCNAVTMESRCLSLIGKVHMFALR